MSNKKSTFTQIMEQVQDRPFLEAFSVIFSAVFMFLFFAALGLAIRIGVIVLFIWLIVLGLQWVDILPTPLSTLWN